MTTDPYILLFSIDCGACAQEAMPEWTSCSCVLRLSTLARNQWPAIKERLLFVRWSHTTSQIDTGLGWAIIASQQTRYIQLNIGSMLGQRRRRGPTLGFANPDNFATKGNINSWYIGGLGLCCSAKAKGSNCWNLHTHVRNVAYCL